MTSQTSSVLAPASAARQPSPYDSVAAGLTVARATKRQLLSVSRTIEAQAQALRDSASTVLVTFQDRRHVTSATRASYARLTRRGTRVIIFARGLTSDYSPDSDGLLHVALTAADPLALEWDIVVRGPAPFALLARDLDPGTAVTGADMNRPFGWVRTTDPDAVHRAAQALLLRVPAQG